MSKKIIGIMGAMPQEIEGVIALLDTPEQTVMGMRTYTSGHLNGIPTVVVFSRWGKVAAAATVSALIHNYSITELIFTGVAGAIDPALNIGDIVVATRLVQHDMDARPLMPQFEIPLLGKTYFETAPEQLKPAKNAIAALIKNNTLSHTIGKNVFKEFGIGLPVLHTGDIASGDKFFADNTQKDNLHNSLPSALCVEMEGAAVAQVCYEYGIPFTIIRTISDSADGQSHIDFPRFIQKISSHYSVCIISELYKNTTVFK